MRNGPLVSLKHRFRSLVIADGHGFARIGGKVIEFSNFRHGCHLRRLSIVVDDRFPNRQVTPFCIRRVEAPRVKIFILTFRGAIGLDH